jgi:hypothetical protein
MAVSSLAAGFVVADCCEGCFPIAGWVGGVGVGWRGGGGRVDHHGVQHGFEEVCFAGEPVVEDALRQLGFFGDASSCQRCHPISGHHAHGSGNERVALTRVAALGVTFRRAGHAVSLPDPPSQRGLRCCRPHMSIGSIVHI